MKHVLAILVVVSGSAFAADNGSQYQWQTPADKWEVTPRLGLINMTNAPKVGTETKTSGMNISVKGEYGISEQFSTGLMLSNVNYSTDTTPEFKQTGMEDLVAFFHGRSAMGGGSLRYGADLGFSLVKAENKSATESNASSGGLSVTPFVGFEMQAAPCTYGARLSYKMYTGDRSVKNPAPAAEDKLSGPTTTTLSLFYEHDMAPMTLGAALEIAGQSSTEDKTTPPSTKSSGNTLTGIKLYVPYMASESITVLPEFKYAKATSMPSTTDSVTMWELAVGGRFSF